MKRFMETNEMTYNLMSFSGFKGVLLFSYLLDGPKSYVQMQKYLSNNQYLNESTSIDTIRIYLNSLKKIGCEINYKTKNKIKYYWISSHPFELKINDEQTKSILKVFKAISKSVDLDDFMALRSFFEKISPHIINNKLKNEILKISPLKDIDLDILAKLRTYTRDKKSITVLYDSNNTKLKEIDVIADKLFILNGKLYLSGYNSEHKNYGNLIVSHIKDIVSDNAQIELEEPKVYCIRYQYKSENNSDFELLDNEKIIESDDEKLIVEITSENKFFIIQRILSHTNKCTVISPQDFKQEIISHLKQIKEGYFG